MSETALAGELRREQNRSDPARHQFSVLCWRGWCDYEFRIRDVPLMVTAVTGKLYPPAAHLPRSECPTPDTCECECHDAPKEAARVTTGHDRRFRCAKALLVFTVTDDDGSTRCVTCGRILRASEAGAS